MNATPIQSPEETRAREARAQKDNFAGLRLAEYPSEGAIAKVTAWSARMMSKLPEPVLGLAGRPSNARGYRLDAQVAASLRALAVMAPVDIVDVPPTKGRVIIDREARLGAGPRVEVEHVLEHEIAGVRVRHYRPEGVNLSDELATVVYFHGGGWTLGSLDSHDNTCRYLCARAGVAVVSVDYRLAPENPFPSGLEDCEAVVKEILGGRVGGTDPNAVVVAGDSAGGNLAAAVCLKLRDTGERLPILQMLFVPTLDLANYDESGPLTDSAREFARGLFLTAEHMNWYADQYCASWSDRSNPYASPLLADDLAGLPPAFISVAGFDPLRDEGEAYAARLRDAGNRVSLRVNEGLVHPFVNSFGIWDAARAALDEAVGALRMELGWG